MSRLWQWIYSEFKWWSGPVPLYGLSHLISQWIYRSVMFRKGVHAGGYVKLGSILSS